MQINLHMEIRVILGTVLFNYDLLFFKLDQNYSKGKKKVSLENRLTSNSIDLNFHYTCK